MRRIALGIFGQLFNMKKQFAILFFLSVSMLGFGQELTQAQMDSIKTVLDKMSEEDQRPRLQLTFGELDMKKIDSIDKALSSKEEFDLYNKVMKGEVGFSKAVRDSLLREENRIDSLNKTKLLEIIRQYGFPSFKRVGTTAGDFMTIHMLGKENFDELLPIFQKEVEKGNMSGHYYASWNDRCQIVMNKKQLYGEYDQKNICVENLKETNKERKKIGLLPYDKSKENKCIEGSYMQTVE